MNSVQLPIAPNLLADEITQVRNLTAYLQADFRSWEKGETDKYRIMTDLFLTEHYLARYLQILESAAVDQQKPEPQPEPRRNNIYLLPTSGGKNRQVRTI
ncbi:MAG: hypothetical protein VR65_06125 [Desulfobulbaceae bacterium BRH_c16a]|nr:MAG: hypothetical protein VR65_06125 [Desulfobulbaceae bacterium BRH_c16a]